MKSKNMQFSGRGVISLLIAVWLLAMTAIPALAWFDEGVDGQPTWSCRAISNGEGLGLISCGQTTQHPTVPVALKRSSISPGVARAEQMFLRNEQPVQLVAEH